ncbi:NAD(P)/FAD-dependent oxidoreductase [Hydrogenophaga sp. BPS33]|uniref:NAD(P)/FAD-dependent oxidoreductase n=1 Tax=Hydrogenophaga sp. BPS33 TaxID=2651974 RepID=UPI00131FE1DB|nr:NAD(P)/FAD-dependent oxidoreductase [Hydrogenophaga sp. BPS33]QHE87569.1 NAD(P)/FAD-dependent oxidoreductase [Hydrogenophaga sp. BPS33]
MQTTTDLNDAIVIGGSYAGLSAAMQLARARRRVMVIDEGMRRNRFARASHGFIGQDGRDPGTIAAEARAQLLAYPNVVWRDGSAVHAESFDGGFRVAMADGAPVQARKLVIATGVVDELPAIDGLAQRWGTSVFHCPYCHGYELDEGRIGVLASSALSMHHALMLPDWGATTFFLNDAFEPDEAQRAALAARGAAVVAGAIARLADAATVVLHDGRRFEMDGLFTVTRTHLGGTVAQQLGCALDEGPTGAFIRTDALQATSVPGVFACGDAARAAGNVAISVGAGAMAGASAHRSLMFDGPRTGRNQRNLGVT